ncbi:MAG: TIGR03617 family F420-dependent LLM class oxidoreductase [Gammaproteobacteria bacterium]|nr:TIGR03617 family F420-dependent LLM class oxidoreductase [Gammaproteobacteria bacterium]
MRVYSMVRPKKLSEIPEAMARAERLGYDGTTLLELTVPPTLSAAAGAMMTKKIKMLSGVFVAFPRSPMATAYDAWAINELSGGRFQLGIGSQIKAHLTRRFGMDFQPPVRRMKDYIKALRAIWECWQNGTKLDYDGIYYKHNLMIPYYNPGPLETGLPEIHLAAINKFMCRLCGELTDGHLPGDPITWKWHEEIMLPNLEIGLERSGRTLKDLDLGGYGFIGCATTDAGIDHVATGLKERVALYASTPEYAEMLEMHGWDVGVADFIELSRENKWKEMGNLVSDKMLEAYSVIARPDDLPAALRKRYGGKVNRIQIDETWFDGLSDDQVAKLVGEIKKI